MNFFVLSLYDHPFISALHTEEQNTHRLQCTYCRNKMKNKIYHTVGTTPKYTTLSEQLQNIPHCRNNSKIYHTVGTTPKSNIKIIERGKE